MCVANMDLSDLFQESPVAATCESQKRTTSRGARTLRESMARSSIHQSLQLRDDANLPSQDALLLIQVVGHGRVSLATEHGFGS